MMLSSLPYLELAASFYATIFIGFGFLWFINPPKALSFFELPYPEVTTKSPTKKGSADAKKTMDAFSVAYGVREIFMGVAIYAAALCGTRQALGWIVIAAGCVAGTDGATTNKTGKPLNHGIMIDRRRINGPAGGTVPPAFAEPYPASQGISRVRTRGPNQVRKIFLKTGLTPSASGSAYLELEPSSGTSPHPRHLSNRSSALKLTCTVHGPRPLPRSAPLTPQLLLSTHIKFAPFASRQRRGYVRDANERDLAVHLETALRGTLISERWPKSGVDVVISVLEGDEDYYEDDSIALTEGGPSQNQGLGMISTLSGCITVASAAIADAGIDCVDFVTGGVAAIVRQPTTNTLKSKSTVALDHTEAADLTLIDPCPAEHDGLGAVCVVGYLQSRDEVTEIWFKGEAFANKNHTAQNHTAIEHMIERAVEAAARVRPVVVEALKESTRIKLQRSSLTKG